MKKEKKKILGTKPYKTQTLLKMKATTEKVKTC